MTIPLIQTQDGFEAVRNAMANILSTESVNQQALATAWNVANPTEEQLEPDEWKLDVYAERSNPWEVFREDDLSSQVVNVWYESSDADGGRSSAARQWTNSRINIDCIACAITKETDTGQTSGDKYAFLRANKIARLCRRILMHPDYVRFGLNSIVNKREMGARRAFQPNSEGVPHRHAAVIQLQFDVSHIEEYDFSELSASEGALITIYREPDGPIIAQMDFDWTV